LHIRRAVAFAVAATLTLVLAFNGGGFDVVIRQQVGLALWGVIALGVGIGIFPRARLNAAAWTGLGGLAGLALLTLLAHTWTESSEFTTEELARVLQYTGVVALAFVALNRYTWRGAAAGFAFAALVVPIFALASRLYPNAIGDSFSQAGGDRLSYPFDYWNAVACWGAMATAIGLTLSANASRMEVRAASLACVPVAVLSVFLSYSRFGAAAIVIAVIATVALSRHRWTAVANAIVAGAASGAVALVVRSQDQIAHNTGTRGAGAVVLALIVAGIGCAVVAAITQRARLDRVRMDPGSARLALGAGVVGVLLLAVALNGPIGTAWDKFKNDRPPPATGGTVRFTSLGSARYTVWTSAVNAFEAHPLDGVGPGSFEYYWAQHGNGDFVKDAHSLYLEEMAELGIPGLIALLAGLIGLLVAGIQARVRWRRRREMSVGSAMIAAFVVFLIYAGVDWMWEMGAIGVLAFGGIAAAAAGGFDRIGGSIPIWLRAAIVAVALLAGATQVPGLVSTERTRASQTALAAHDPQRALQLANEAIDAEPWAGSAWAAKAEAQEAAGDLAAARSDVGDAIERDPNNWRQYLLLARINAERGDRAAVVAALRQAHRLAPRSLYLNPLSPYRRSLNALLARRAASSRG
jgi:hypothetical protein